MRSTAINTVSSSLFTFMGFPSKPMIPDYFGLSISFAFIGPKHLFPVSLTQRDMVEKCTLSLFETFLRGVLSSTTLLIDSLIILLLYLLYFVFLLIEKLFLHDLQRYL